MKQCRAMISMGDNYNSIFFKHRNASVEDEHRLYFEVEQFADPVEES